ncbi:hypothetical protein OKW36_002579 [Paraburkholderia sp. MM5482-R1]
MGRSIGWNGERALYSEPRMIVLMGLVFGAVTIGAYVSQLDNDWSSGRDVSLVADGERGVSATGAAAGQSEGRPGAATVAPATRRHALRDDVAALRAQPAASIGAQAGDALAIAALQFARESNKAQQQPHPQPQPQQTSLPPQPAVTSNWTQAPPTAKTGHAHHSRVASGTTTKPHSAQSVATTSGSHARGGSHRKSSTAERSGKKAASVVPEARPLPQYATQGVESPWSMPRAGLTSPSATQAVASNGPKTRAEVEAELVRARENGTMPAFGRPEPSGPGAH